MGREIRPRDGRARGRKTVRPKDGLGRAPTVIRAGQSEPSSNRPASGFPDHGIGLPCNLKGSNPLFPGLRPPLTEQGQICIYLRETKVWESLPCGIILPEKHAERCFTARSTSCRFGFDHEHLVVKRGLQHRLRCGFHIQRLTCQTQVFLDCRRCQIKKHRNILHRFSVANPL